MDHTRDLQSTSDIEQALDAVESVIGDLQATEPRPQPERLVGYQTELAEKANEIDAATAGAGLTAPVPTPPPKRPKGRLVIGAFLMGLLLAGLYIVWDGVFRYHAYGLVAANRISIPSPTTGIVNRVCVTEGDRVDAGEILIVIDDVVLQQDLDRTREELRLAEARLDAHVSDLRRDALKRAVLQKWDVHDNAAEMFELASSLRQHRAEAERLERELVRQQRLHENEAATDEQLDRVLFALKGELELIEELTAAVDELKTRQDIIPIEESVDLNQMKPALVQIENLQQETQRLIKRLRESRVTAPVSGTIVRHQCVVGGRVIPDQVLLEIIQDGTVEPVVYFSQADTRPLETGSELTLHVEPLGEPLKCVVRMIGEEYSPAPASIERFYGRHEPLLRVTLRPPSDVQLKPGAIVRVPHAL